MFMLKLNPKLLQEAFPINKVEVFFDAEDHSNFLGFTWEMISQGRVPVGLDTSDTDFNEIGKTGGEKTHTLTVNEMPSHKHNVSFSTVLGNAEQRLALGANSGTTGTTGVYGTPTVNAGGNQPHNNLQPYIVMAFWKRIA